MTEAKPLVSNHYLFTEQPEACWHVDNKNACPLPNILLCSSHFWYVRKNTEESWLLKPLLQLPNDTSISHHVLNVNFRIFILQHKILHGVSVPPIFKYCFNNNVLKHQSTKIHLTYITVGSSAFSDAAPLMTENKSWWVYHSTTPVSLKRIPINHINKQTE